MHSSNLWFLSYSKDGEEEEEETNENEDDAKIKLCLKLCRMFTYQHKTYIDILYLLNV